MKFTELLIIQSANTFQVKRDKITTDMKKCNNGSLVYVQ